MKSHNRKAKHPSPMILKKWIFEKMDLSENGFFFDNLKASLLISKLVQKEIVWFGLVCWVLGHINICRLFDTKSIFM